MSNLYVVLLCAAVCLACDEDLHYRISMGNYVIVNPDPQSYNGIQAYNAKGDACTTTVIPMYAFTVTGCGLVSMIGLYEPRHDKACLKSILTTNLSAD